MSKRLQLIVFLVPIVMLVLALGNMPWGYYQLLRLVIAAACAFITVVMFAGGKQGPGIIFLVLALVYNPFIPLHIGRGAWEIVNIATIIMLLAGLAISRSIVTPAGRS